MVGFVMAVLLVAPGFEGEPRPAVVLDVSSRSVMLAQQEATLRTLLALAVPHEAPLSNREVLATQAAFYVQLAALPDARRRLAELEQREATRVTTQSVLLALGGLLVGFVVGRASSRSRSKATPA